MPGVIPPPSELLYNTIRDLQRQVRAIASQQQNIISNSQGQMVASTGLVPPARTVPAGQAWYGDAYYKPGSGLLAFFGEDDSGTVALRFFDGNGTLRASFDEEGLHFYDASGTEQVRLGELNASPAVYGLGVLPPGGGSLQRVGGYVWGAADDMTNVVSNGAWITPTNADTVSAVIGPSGLAQVSVNAEIATGGDNVEGFLGVDCGGTIYGFLGTSVGTAGGMNVSATASYIVSGLATNQVNNFVLQVETANAASGSAVNYYDMRLVVQPL